MRKTVAGVVAALVMVASSALPAAAQTAADKFKGKNFEVIVGYDMAPTIISRFLVSSKVLIGEDTRRQP
jgi:hypothetical protein